MGDESACTNSEIDSVQGDKMTVHKLPSGEIILRSLCSGCDKNEEGGPRVLLANGDQVELSRLHNLPDTVVGEYGMESNVVRATYRVDCSQIGCFKNPRFLVLPHNDIRHVIHLSDLVGSGVIITVVEEATGSISQDFFVRATMGH